MSSAMKFREVKFRGRHDFGGYLTSQWSLANPQFAGWAAEGAGDAVLVTSPSGEEWLIPWGEVVEGRLVERVGGPGLTSAPPEPAPAPTPKPAPKLSAPRSAK